MSRAVIKDHFHAETGEYLYTRAYFICPACRHVHMPNVKVPQGSEIPCWGFNGNLELPTFDPSILTRRSKRDANGEIVWITKENGEREVALETECHSFVQNGKIIYCGDSAHSMAGQTVDLPEIPADHWLND